MVSLWRFNGSSVAFVLAMGCASSYHAPTAIQTSPEQERTPSPLAPVLSTQPEKPDISPGDDATTVVEEESLPHLPRMTSVALFTYIYAVPSRGAWQLGYLHIGSSLPLRRAEPIRSAGCDTAWYAVEPRGYICNDNTTILETDRRKLSPSAERLLKGYQSTAPRDGPFPYGYALSLGTPMYGRIPDPSERQRHESMYGPPPVSLGRWAKGHDDLASADSVAAPGEVPWFLENGDYAPVTVRGGDAKLVRKHVPRGAMISYSSVFEADGRTWLLTPNLSVVPADRVRAYRQSLFHGVDLGDSLSLPIAWIRKSPRPKWRLQRSDRIALTEETWRLRSAVGLTGKRVEQGDQVFLETVDAGAFIDEADATIVDKSPGRPPRVGAADKWIQISVQKGTLTAYEGNEPVFATLVSPGLGGLQSSKYPSIRTLATRHITPLGAYRIQYKDRFSVMSPDLKEKGFFISDVPYIQYFSGPFSLHAAYWHEDFGEPKSGGCINLAPEDAKRLFGWTDPPVPSGWHGLRTGGPNGRGTIVQIVP
jgi:hypothetical protein